MDNCVKTVIGVLKELNVKYTSSYVKDVVLSHPNHPSLLVVSDALDKYNIRTLPVKVGHKKLNDFPTPFVVQVKKENHFLFYVIEYIDNNFIKFRNESNQKLKLSLKDFKSIWTGVCLLVEATIDTKEEGIKQKLFSKKLNLFFIGILVALFFLWVLFDFTEYKIDEASNSYFFIGGFFLLKLLGFLIGTMLLWYEVDQFNPVLQKICKGGSMHKKNCDAVLHSKYASFFNGSISLSLVCFSYFFGTFFFLLINHYSISSISLLGLFSFLSIPVVLVSFFTQAFIIKQWCKFCIVIQVIILTECIFLFIGEFYPFTISFDLIPSLLFLLTLPIVLWNPLKNLLNRQKEVVLYKRGLAKIKNNKEVFWSLLQHSRKIKNKTEGLGIFLENPQAKHKVVKVCNPYCGPCTQAHPILDELLMSNKISLQILFTAKNSMDNVGKITAHFLAIASASNDQNKIRKCLNEWYSLKQKDYVEFSKKYPISNMLKNYNDKIEKMKEWCDQEEVRFTPTLFINGHQLPNEYSVTDLKEVFL